MAGSRLGGTAFGRDVLSAGCRTRNAGRGGTVVETAGLPAVSLAGMLSDSRHAGLARGRSHRLAAVRCNHGLMMRRGRGRVRIGGAMVVRTAAGDNVDRSSAVMVVTMVMMVATAAKTNAYRHQ